MQSNPLFFALFRHIPQPAVDGAFDVNFSRFYAKFP